jgi:hypothetical protein
VPRTTSHSTRNVLRTQQEKKGRVLLCHVHIFLLGFRMKRQAKQAKPVVGFYRDRDGKTKPITKSAADLNRKKLIENGHGFKGVGVVARVRNLPQAPGGFDGRAGFGSGSLVAFD